MSYRDMALKLLNQVPVNTMNQSDAQFALSGINAIRNNDVSQGEQIANDILQKVGMTREQAMQIAQQRLGHLL